MKGNKRWEWNRKRNVRMYFHLIKRLQCQHTMEHNQAVRKSWFIDMDIKIISYNQPNDHLELYCVNKFCLISMSKVIHTKYLNSYNQKMILLCTIRITELKNIDKNSNKTLGVMDCSS